MPIYLIVNMIMAKNIFKAICEFDSKNMKIALKSGAHLEQWEQ